MEISRNTATGHGNWLLRRFFVRKDAVYDSYTTAYQAESAAAKIIYLSLYLLPGLLGYLLVNVGPVFRIQLRVTGLSPENLQLAWLLIITFGWHMFAPVLILRYSDKLTPRQIVEFLGLNRVDWRGLLLVLPIYCACFAAVSVLYMTFVSNPLQHWLASVPAFRIPSYSIFRSAEIYSFFPPVALLFLFVGNFFGEELYFRAYLMKKTAFLGQIPQTWPLIGLVL